MEKLMLVCKNSLSGDGVWKCLLGYSKQLTNRAKVTSVLKGAPRRYKGVAKARGVALPPRKWTLAADLGMAQKGVK